MRVQASQLSFAVQHRQGVQHEREERLRTWVGDRRPDFEGEEARGLARPAPGPLDLLQAKLQRQARQLAQAKAAAAPPPRALHGRDPPPPANADPLANLDPKTKKMLLLLEKLFGIKDIRSLSFGFTVSQVQGVQGQVLEQDGTAPVGWGMEYDYHEFYRAYESTTLDASGSLTTADGRSFTFTLSYSQTWEFTSRTDISLRAGDARRVDPLALDLGGQGLAFSPERMGIDLDQDGRLEQVHRLSGSARWLALDRNGNGRVDDGGELFGTTSGDGFLDLQALDGDGNGWIDAADQAFAQLLLWDGDLLVPLAQTGIGALGTMAIEAPFTHRDAQGEEAAQTRKLGLFLRNDGSAGVAAQVDLVA